MTTPLSLRGVRRGGRRSNPKELRDCFADVRNDSASGFSTLEMLIALALIVTSISAVISVAFGNQSISVDAQTNDEALAKAQELLENARANARLDFNLVNPIPEAPDDIYQKSLEVVSLPDFFTKRVAGKVTWEGEPNRDLYVELTTLVTNPEALSGGDTCSSVLEGDWTDPQKTEYEFGSEILGDTSSGFPITSIQAFQGKMFVTVNNSHGNNDGVFFILDISDQSIKPALIGGLDNSLSVSEGLNDVAVDGGSFAYVANAYDSSPGTCDADHNCAQLQIINISNPTNPTLVKNMKLPRFTVGGNLAAGNRVFYKDGIVYLGLANSTGPEFNIIDVGGGGSLGASSTNPILIGSYEIGNGINSIQVRGDYAYIASPNDQELIILNISDPTIPVLVGGFYAPGGGGNNGNGKSMYLVGNILYLGRTQLNGNEFYILDNTNSETNLPILGASNILDNGNGTSVNGILTRDFLTFLITNREFQILRTDDPNSIIPYASPLPLPPGSGGVQGTATDCEGNYIYVGSQKTAAGLGGQDKGYISIITGGL